MIGLAIIVLGSIVTSFLANWYVRSNKRARYVGKRDFENAAFGKASFEDQLKAAGMKPETEVTCGQNTFACDREKGKLLVQTQHVPEGVLLHSRDVLSYTLLRDGQTIAQRGRNDGEGIAAVNLSSDCERIELRLETKHKDYPNITLVLMPFRFERAETRDSAMEAARRISAALEEILSERE